MKLQTKIISTVIIISFIVNIFFQYNSIRLQRKDSLLSLSEKMNYTSELLNRINAGPLFYYDTQLIETNIKSFLKDPEIKSIYVIESSGEINLYYENAGISKRNLIEVETDVFYEGDKIGKIITTFTKDVINKQLSDSIKTTIISIIFALVIIGIFLLLIIRRIIKPIMELTELSYEISNGNLDKEIHIHSKDEIGKLAKSFIRMRDSIKEKIESLNIENDERKKAEIALRIRTEELAGANKELTAHRIHLEELVTKRTAELQESLNTLEKTKDQLVISEKMASLGDLVAGVAHEINTPIGIGVTAASHLENETKIFIDAYEKGELSKSLFEKYVELADESSRMILANMIRAASLIQSFKKVAVDQSSEEKRPFKVREYIDEVLLSIHSKFKHTNFTIKVLCEEDFVLNSYPGALSQIITNLSINSLQHGFEGLNKGEITIQITRMGDNANITYTDDGIGIPASILKKIFNPFFTTKRGRGGSGLGMNIVYNLITQTLKGTIECTSTQGEGTIFNINLPITV